MKVEKCIDQAKALTLEEEKQLELQILQDVTDFCDAHGLTYFLTYGTLIGAVRHKGFIPWDDDVDIQMPRPDYNKFLALYNKEKGADARFVAIDPYHKHAKFSFTKVVDTKTVKAEIGLKYKGNTMGVDIDIFPIDGMPSDEEEYRKWFKKLHKIYTAHRIKTMSYARTFARSCAVYAYKARLLFTSRDRLLKKAERLHAMYPYETSEYAGTKESIVNGIGNRSKKSNYEGFVLVEFEGRQFKAPKGYDDVLRNLFGDYMQLPPEEKRVAHHVQKVFYKE